MKNIKSLIIGGFGSLLAWMKTHPIQLVWFVWLATLVSVFVSFRADLFIPGLIIFGILLIVVGVSIWKGSTKLILTMITCLSLVASSYSQELTSSNRVDDEKATPASIVCTGVAIGVVVLCVGGCVTYKISKFCQRKFPKTSPPSVNSSTNSPPTNTVSRSLNLHEDTYAASYNFGHLGSCWLEDPCYGGSDPSFTTSNIELSLIRDTDEEIPFQDRVCMLKGNITTRKDDQAVQSWTEYVDESLQQGVYLSGYGDQSQFFALNGVPISSEDSPISFDVVNRAVRLRNDNSETVYAITVERSSDMRRWVPILLTYVPVGTKFNVLDTSWEKQVFYRYRARLYD